MIYSKETVDRIRDLLVKKSETMAVAESVTCGHLQAALSIATDASLFFQGGITAYNLGQKCRHLSVEPIHALDCDCVSESVSAQMAIEVCRLFACDYGIGVTGYATPIPEKGVKDLFAYMSVAKKGTIILSKKLTPGNATAFDAQVAFARQVLEELAAILNK